MFSLFWPKELQKELNAKIYLFLTFVIIGFLERTLQCAQTLFLYCFAHKDMKKDPLKRRTLAKLQNFSKNCQNRWKLTKLIQCFLYWHINTFRFQEMWWTHFVGYRAPLRSKSTSQMNQRLGRKYPTKVCIRSSAVSVPNVFFCKDLSLVVTK